MALEYISGAGSDRDEKMDAVDADRVFGFKTAAALADESCGVSSGPHRNEGC